jgi:CO/xanthine dehydrogenase FAD-binding subunit
MPKVALPLPQSAHLSLRANKVKPANFDYIRASSVDEAVTALARAGGDGKIIAGGQSLMPMINFRLVRPSMLVDINHISGLDRIEDVGERLRIGALVRHCTTASDPLIAEHVPVLPYVMQHVAHLTVRNRGTFCGSVCHADPAAEMPMMAHLLNAVVEIASPRGVRRLDISEFITSSLTTALESDELVTAIEVEKLFSGSGWGFEEFARRHGDYALAAVVATMRHRDGCAHDVRIAVMGVGDRAMRVTAVESILEGSTMNKSAIADGVAALRANIEPMADLSASADYRRHLAGELAGNVLRAAWARAGERVSA